MRLRLGLCVTGVPLLTWARLSATPARRWDFRHHWLPVVGLAAAAVVWFCALLFNCLFWVLAAREWKLNRISPATYAYTFSRKHYNLVLIGLFNALNGIFVVYSSSATRVPTALQPILLQAVLPFTLVFSKPLLHKKWVLIATPPPAPHHCLATPSPVFPYFTAFVYVVLFRGDAGTLADSSWAAWLSC